MKIDKSFPFDASLGHVGQQEFIAILISNQTIKKGCNKNVQYVVIKRYKQKHLHFQHSSTLLPPNLSSNNTDVIPTHKNYCSVKTATDSISTILSSSKIDQPDAVSSSLSTQFYPFNFFDS